MSAEFNALISNGTWELVPHDPTHNLIGCKWLDVNNAFLHGILCDTVYMSQPPGFVDANLPSYVCKLQKAHYGLKQAPHAWYKELSSFLLSNDFRNATSDASLFISTFGSHVIYFLVYVDDLIVIGNNSSLVMQFIATLARRFSVKDLGSLHYFLGVEVVPTTTGLFLSQHHYIRDLLLKAKMDGAKEVSTPLSPSDNLVLNDGSPPTDASQFHQIIGGLQYLNLTRPNISFVQFMHQTSESHRQALKRLICYLKGTLYFGLHLSRHSSHRLYAFSNANWADNRDDRKSTNAYCCVYPSASSHTSRKQRSVARSSTETEYRAIATTTAEIAWIQSLLRKLGISLPAPPLISYDNIGATFYCANLVLHSRMKQIDINLQFVRDHVSSGLLQVSHVSTVDQLVDAFTKPLPLLRFQLLRNKIGVSNGTTVLRGRKREPSSKEITSSSKQSSAIFHQSQP
ncbi:hypothetical protein L3X38_016533 [Prunus dulcis]|uniref:Reverse transcriptase Ty1/copia-type domain-containing protein n=1 Tax=Prunus dulcis TaxID=3755 RepID=A0AAD4W756_PRUDU|nr:hypothetical protein L3X38_016533 [Prunus dulcis]